MSPAKLLKKFLAPAFLRYLLVGGFGFALDAGGTEILFHLGFDLAAARALAMTGAIGCTYLFHRYYTFTDSRQPQETSNQLTAFVIVQLTAAALNFGVFHEITMLQPRLMTVPLPYPWQDIFRVFSIGVGVGVGLVFNFLVLRMFVFQVAANDEGPVRTETSAERRARLRRLYWRAGTWVVFILSMVLPALSRQAQVLLFPDMKGPLNPPDPDVWMRLTEVRQWIAGAFFDHAVKNTNAPLGGVVTPWTRPLDALLAVFYVFTPVKFAMNVRLMLAATWLPPLLSGIALALMSGAAQRMFHHRHIFIFVVLLWMTNADIYDYFSAGDSDHHGLLCTLWCGVLMLMMGRDLSRAAAGGIGVLLGVMIWISPEALIVTGFVFALLGLEGLLKPGRMENLAAAAIGAAVTANTALHIEMPPGEAMSRLTYDSLSIVQVSLLWLTVAGASGLAALYRRPLSLSARFCAASLAGAFVMLGMYALFPRFFLGPLADVDPFVISDFLPNVAEATPMFEGVWEDILRQVAAPALAALLLGFVASRRLRPDRRRRLILLAALLAGTFALTMAQLRWDYYLQPVAIVAAAALLPGVLGGMRKPLRYVPRGWRPYICLWALFMAVELGMRVHTTQASATGICMAQMRYVIQTQQLQALLGDRPVVLYTPADVGGDVLFFTPFRIIASNYHREGKGLKDLKRLETAATPEAAHAVLTERKAGAMLYCPARLPEHSWLRHIAEDGKYPDWLAPVPGLRLMEASGPLPVLMKVRN